MNHHNDNHNYKGRSRSNTGVANVTSGSSKSVLQQLAEIQNRISFVSGHDDANLLLVENPSN